MRIRNSDAQGHTDYLTGFIKTTEEELYKALRRVGIQASELSLHEDGVYDSHLSEKYRYFVPVLTHTEYKEEIFLGNHVDAIVNIVGINKNAGQIFLSHALNKNSGTTASTGYYVLQKHERGRVAPLSDNEAIRFGRMLQTTYSASENSFRAPVLKAPVQVVGTQVTLIEYIFTRKKIPKEKPSRKVNIPGLAQLRIKLAILLPSHAAAMLC